MILLHRKANEPKQLEVAEKSNLRLADSCVILLLQMHSSNYEIASQSFILAFFNRNISLKPGNNNKMISLSNAEA